jgi:hypothetical protein
MTAAPIVDYNSLIAAVDDILQRNGSVNSVIQACIPLAEDNFNDAIRNRRMEIRVITSTVAGQEYLQLPNDFRMIEAIRVLDSNFGPIPIEFKTDYEMDRLDDQFMTFNSSIPDAPAFASISGNQLRLVPTPQSIFTIEIRYAQAVPPLALGTNWLITTRPRVYLYRTLYEVCNWLQDSTNAGKYLAQYDKVWMEVDVASRREKRGKGPIYSSAMGGWAP